MKESGNIGKIYGNIIVDHTHAFFQKPLPGVDTLYSCRKFWGSVTGHMCLRMLSASGKETAGSFHGKTMSTFWDVMKYDAGTFYQKMLDNAADYHEMEIRRMSRLTGNLLRAIDYPDIKAKRRELCICCQNFFRQRLYLTGDS